jgi:hypothetical protein
MPAPGRGVRGVLRAVAFVALALPAVARAQTMVVVGSPQTLFDGNLLTIRVSIQQSLTSDVLFSLPPGFTVVSLGNGLDAPYVSKDTLAGCSLSGGVYTCPDVDLPPVPLISIVPGTGGVAQTVHLRDRPGDTSAWEHVYDLVVRLSLPSCGPVPLQVVVQDNLQHTISFDDPALCSQDAVPTGLVLQPVGGGAADAQRGGTPLVLELRAHMPTGELRPVQATLDDPIMLASALSCRRTPAVSTPGACDSGDFAGLATITGADGSADLQTTATLTFTPKDSLSPLAGDAEVTARLVGAHTISGTVAITVEHAATTLIASASPSATIPVPGQRALVVEARNAKGGHEPAVAAWTVQSTTPASFQTLATSWLDAPGAVLNVQTMPPQPVQVQLHATHTNPGGSTIGADLLVNVSRAATTCALVATPQTLGPGAHASVQLQVTGGNTVGLGTVWTVSGGGTIDVDPIDQTHVTYNAPPTEATSTVTVALSGGVCPQASLSTTLQVQTDVKLSWSFMKPRVEAGGILRAQAVLENERAAPIAGLVLQLKVSAGLAAVDSLPRFGSSTQVTNPSPRGKQLSYTVGLDATSRHELAFAFLARSGFGCGPATVDAALLREAGGQPIATAQGKVEVACEHELTDATVFGQIGRAHV